MNFSPELLQLHLQKPLPGLRAHQTVMSYVRNTAQTIRQLSTDYREGAVLILLYPMGSTLRTGLIVRPLYDGVHSGQVAFPGGRREVSDGDLFETAMREAHEEVGVRQSEVKLLGQLSEIYIPPSNFLVQPYVGYAAQRPNYVLDPREVAGILEPRIGDILQADAIRKRRVQLSNGTQITVDCFELEGRVVWGATAMMLAELRAVLESLPR